jgi:phosphoribosylglycinamide formyltransferase 1
MEDPTATPSALSRLVVLASGNGTNLQAVVDACELGDLPATLAAVISDKADSGALRRAAGHGIPGLHIARDPDEEREAYDARLAHVVAEFEPDWVVLAGWMRLLSMRFLSHFPQRVVNLHPALPGELPGLRSIERAHAEAMAGTRDHTGVMVHLVPDEGVDNGPVLGVITVPIAATDSLDALEDHMHRAEHELLVATLTHLCRQGAHA